MTRAAISAFKPPRPVGGPSTVCVGAHCGPTHGPQHVGNTTQPHLPSFVHMPKRAAAAANPQLREFHQLGRHVLAADKVCAPRGRGRYNYGTFEVMHDRTGRPRSYLLCARRFAQQYPTTKDLDWICNLGRRQGRPLTRKHVFRLIVLRDDHWRNRLAQRCASEGWSSQRLALEVQRLQPKRTYGGRRPPRPRDVKEALGALELMTSRWTRWCEVLVGVDNPRQGARFTDLPKSVRGRLRRSTEVIGELNKAVSRELQKKR